MPDAAVPPLPATFAITGATVIAGDDLRVLDPGHVVVRDGLIVETGPGSGPTGVTTVDLPGRVVVPAFINAHTHIEDAGVRELGFGVSKGVNLLFEPDGLRHRAMAEQGPDEVRAAIREAAREMISYGVVAFADYRTGGASGAATVREACAGLPIRALVFGGHSRFPVQSDDELRSNRGALTAAQIADVEETIGVADGFAPVRVNDTTDEALRQIEKVVRRAGKRLSTHAAASPDYRAFSLERTGRSDIDRAIEILAPDFVVHMTVATRSEIGQVVDAGIPMVMCPRAMAALGRPLPPYHVAVSEGAVVSLGTDNVMTSSPDLLAESDFLARALRSVEGDPSVVDARRLLQSLTVDAAKTLGFDDLGSIHAGKAATFLVFDGRRPGLARSANTLASIVSRARPSDIEAVVIDSAVVHGAIPQPRDA
jgi:cytosine/adenosine deaminase-related metal-dependent hydrolase